MILRQCVEARDLIVGDHVVNQAEITSVHTEGDTTTITIKPFGAKVELWAHDHVWVDRAVVGA